MAELVSKCSGCQEDCISLRSEKESLIECLAETSQKVNNLQRELTDQEDISLHYQQQLMGLKCSQDQLQKKIERSIALELRSLTYNRSKDQEDLNCSFLLYEEDEVCVSSLLLFCKSSFLPKPPLPVTQPRHSCLSSIVQTFGCRRSHRVSLLSPARPSPRRGRPVTAQLRLAALMASGV